MYHLMLCTISPGMFIFRVDLNDYLSLLFLQLLPLSFSTIMSTPVICNCHFLPCFICTYIYIYYIHNAFHITTYVQKTTIALSSLIKNYGKQIGKYVRCLYFFLVGICISYHIIFGKCHGIWILCMIQYYKLNLSSRVCLLFSRKAVLAMVMFYN